MKKSIFPPQWGGVVLGAAAVSLVLSGCGASAPTGSASGSSAKLQDTTQEATGDHGPIVWANYRPTATLDPIQAVEQPENTVLNSLCESLLMQQADGTIAPWLAQSVDYTSPTEMSIKLKPGIKFWDGSPVTADDVVFSLERAKDPAKSYYADPLSNVQTVAAVGQNEIKLQLSKPDYWLRGYLATTASMVIKKDYATQAGDSYGKPAGKVMCSGPFKFKSWQAGGDLIIEKNPDYWDSDHKAKVSQITFVAAPSDADLTTGLTSGSINGTLNPVLGTYTQLKASDSLSVTTGWSGIVDALAVLNYDGPLGNRLVREALSKAIDREGYMAAVYPGGQASAPRTSTNSSTWRMDQKVFDEILASEKPMTQDLEAAKSLVAEAGADGKTIVVATTALPSVAAAANAVMQAGAQIGLKVELKNFAVADYANIFFDPSARAGIDIANTLVGPSFADPGAGLSQSVVPGAIYNYADWSSTEVTELLAKARETEDVAERAALAAKADKLVTHELPLIPLAEQTNTVVMSKDITGATASGTYMSGPWSRGIGASGK
ncbi:ABC transporter substrate-binding protein [Paenarthrobacter nitroguajacolicus]|uniref:ABC transporter substrate-binding protein n=1 Tax=Paenarthrobacter nitroguajacolicus TaxID=211146 RepID=UPI003442843F